MAIVKIQHRRGNYADYDPSKVLPGELVVTQADDPNSTDGEAVYIATTAGNVKQLATMQDMQSVVDTAIEGAISGVTEKVEEYIEEIETTGNEVLDSIPADYTQLSEDVDNLKDDLAQIVPGLSAEAKAALLACFEHVAWTDAQGQDYYDTLYEALYEEEPPTPPTPSDVLYKLSNPVYSGGDNSVDTGVIVQRNNGKYSLCIKFIVSNDTPDSTGNSIFSMKYEGSGGNYYNVAINKRVVGRTVTRMMYGMGIPWDDTASVSEGRYTLGAVYSIVLIIDSGNISSKIYVYDTHTKQRYSYDKTLNADYLFNNQSIIAGKEAYHESGFSVVGFTGMIADLLIKKGELTETEINNYLLADIKKTNIIFEIGDIDSSSGANIVQPLRIRSRDYIEVTGSTVTTVGCPFAETWYEYSNNGSRVLAVHTYRCYDSNKNFLGSANMIPDGTSITKANLLNGTKYIRVVIQHGVDAYESGFSQNATYPYYINDKSYAIKEA